MFPQFWHCVLSPGNGGAEGAPSCSFCTVHGDAPSGYQKMFTASACRWQGKGKCKRQATRNGGAAQAAAGPVKLRRGVKCHAARTS